VVLSKTTTAGIGPEARSRALACGHGTPYFQVRRELERLGVVVRSSNYRPLPDMSQRLMATLEPWVRSWRSIRSDEAFGRSHRAASSDLKCAWGLAPARQVRRHLGCRWRCALPPQVLAKLAQAGQSRIPAMAALFDLGSRGRSDPWLAAVAIEGRLGHRPQALALVALCAALAIRCNCASGQR